MRGEGAQAHAVILMPLQFVIPWAKSKGGRVFGRDLDHQTTVLSWEFLVWRGDWRIQAWPCCVQVLHHPIVLLTWKLLILTLVNRFTVLEVAKWDSTYRSLYCSSPQCHSRCSVSLQWAAADLARSIPLSPLWAAFPLSTPCLTSDTFLWIESWIVKLPQDDVRSFQVMPGRGSLSTINPYF